VKEIFLDPPTVQANPDAIRAILQADLIVVGPGSLLTSVLPNVMVEGIRRAMEVSTALKVYVCNVATQHGETDAFKVSDHFNTLKGHLKGSTPFDYVLANSNVNAVLPQEWHSEPVQIDTSKLDGARVIRGDVVAEENRYRHDSKKLADALVRLYYERNQGAEPEAPACCRSGAPLLDASTSRRRPVTATSTSSGGSFHSPGDQRGNVCSAPKSIVYVLRRPCLFRSTTPSSSS
jgi:hypothetical protein